MLRDRLLSSAALIAASLLLMWLDYRYPLGGSAGLWLLPLLLFFALGTVYDASTLMLGSGMSVHRRTTLAATTVVVLAPAIPLLWPLWGARYPLDCPLGTLGWIVCGVLLAMFLVIGREMMVYRLPSAGLLNASRDGENPARGSGTLERTVCGVFGSLYVGVPMSLLVVIRGLPGAVEGETNNASWGLAALITTIAVTKSADAGAYFTGRALGRRKLVPRISPGKTVEGLVGGISTAMIVSFGCFFGLIPAIAEVSQVPPLWGPLVFGATCALAGVWGDLAESLIKRDAGFKDSGAWLPGLGGMWDVTDSLLAAAGPAWVALAVGVAGS